MVEKILYTGFYSNNSTMLKEEKKKMERVERVQWTTRVYTVLFRGRVAAEETVHTVSLTVSQKHSIKLCGRRMREKIEVKLVRTRLIHHE